MSILFFPITQSSRRLSILTLCDLTNSNIANGILFMFWFFLSWHPCKGLFFSLRTSSSRKVLFWSIITLQLSTILKPPKRIYIYWSVMKIYTSVQGQGFSSISYIPKSYCISQYSAKLNMQSLTFWPLCVELSCEHNPIIVSPIKLIWWSKQQHIYTSSRYLAILLFI